MTNKSKTTKPAAEPKEDKADEPVVETAAAPETKEEDTVLPTQQATTEPVNKTIERPAAIEPGKFVCERSGITQVNR